MKSNRFSAGQIALTLGCLFLGIIMALQMKNVISLKQLNIFDNNDVQYLQDQIKNKEIANNELKNRNDELSKNLQALQQVGNDENGQIEVLKKERERYATFAGLTDVVGPGAIISIEYNSPAAYVNAGTLLVLVNGLKSDGVYAISLNGQRFVAMTEISPTGSGAKQNIIVNGTKINSAKGYELRVIAEKEKMQNFYNLNTALWDQIRSQGCQVKIQYLDKVEIAALPKDSPAYRQDLLDSQN